MEWTADWRPSTVGEARQYLDAHELDGDPDIVSACEALFDATPHISGAVKPSEEPRYCMNHSFDYSQKFMDGSTGQKDSVLNEIADERLSP